MNRYPLWKYLLIGLVIVVSAIYALPNLYGETPAVQVSTNRQSIHIDQTTEQAVAEALKAANIQHNGMFIADGSLRVRLPNEELQSKARDVIEQKLGDNYIIALNLIANTPDWMTKLGANPMFLGLDLRGGVHFTMRVDMHAAVDKTFDRISGDFRRQLRKDKIRTGNMRRSGDTLIVPFQDAATLQAALPKLKEIAPDVELKADGNNLVVSLPETTQTQIRDAAVKQNINTLHNRVNELGVAEPIIQQAGPDRIVVQLPGVQDTAKAKDIIGRTATLEVRMVADDPALLQQAEAGNVPAGYELLPTAEGGQLLVSKQVEFTGDNINDAQAGFTHDNRPSVNLKLDNAGTSIFADLTRNNVGRRTAMILIDQGKAEIVTAPTINEPIPGGNVQISGSMNVAEANDTALLLRAGSLAAPMEIIEERTIGPSMGKENIQKGFHSTLWGFLVVAAFMVVYYRLFGIFSVLALTANLLFLVAILSLLQATLTLPGIAAIALTLGMAIDSNVLINERIREELRDGVSPQQAISEGYRHAWDTIVDSNITSLIAGIALLVFGSGAVRGFAVVHCIGILTSMFSSVVVSRTFVNLWYGRRRKLSNLSIGITLPTAKEH
ncbi:MULTISPECIES: protein translocase subunit SecD [Eikenella]|uniref:Protein translocase subunit SecD n=1 Tax=Eikenella corrodens TaxID=539 RepID=A0A1A9RG18_EIKCO|nr:MULTISPECIES: protein translocase subunit SecD [Eikenella]OAM14929.1 protein-export membrane protein SecD [Eikenella corrodens]OAM17178.1 protein-export membrane protein SecD [Eikenella corrodens]OFN59875.1 preprotein translocase subunit SecD [Eikenella sp. HMSC061C02]OWP27125.1 protein translocase subunit SecD [Eikenella corrodens]